MVEESRIPQRVSLAAMKGGGVVEMVDDAIAQVVENIADVNTNPTAKRQVVLTVTLKADEERRDVVVNVDVRTKTAPAQSVRTKLFLLHTRNGLVATEDDPRQPRLFDDEAPAPAGVTHIRSVNGKESTS